MKRGETYEAYKGFEGHEVITITEIRGNVIFYTGSDGVEDWFYKESMFAEALRELRKEDHEDS